jgi:hypothetical protein
MKTFLTISTALTIVTTPVFAQSFCTCDGTGSVLKFPNNPITYYSQAPAIPAVGENGLHAFAMVPRRARGPFNPDDPAVAGGGSLGYNEGLRNY